MIQSTATDFKTACVGPTIDFLEHEIRRVGATADDLRKALTFVTCEQWGDARAYQALSRKSRRLVDLVTVAGPQLAARLLAGADPKAQSVQAA